jgi:multiple sugar transport system permease protein
MAVLGTHRKFLGMSRLEWAEQISGMLFTLPAILGLLVFTAYPILASLYYSFTNYSITSRYRWIGLDNYRKLVEDDPVFWNSLYNTIYYVAGAIPLGITFAFFIAALLNMRIKGLAFYRTIFFLPTIVPAVASAVLWLWLFNPDYGLINGLLALIGISGPGWLVSPTWSKPALILMSLWGVGGTMVIFLAGLQDVPQELYEAAMIDGAGRWAKAWHVTIPFMSPYLLFSLVTGLIGGFQYFAQVYVMTAGGPADSTRMYGLYLFQNGFEYFKMGYASAMAWILFMIVVAVTVIVFRSGARHVYYGGA